jgi:glycosyltransferase involved in cell wall biosynthesis
MPLRVLHIAHGIEKEQTGAGNSIPTLCGVLAEQGIEVTLVALDLGGSLNGEVRGSETLSIHRFPYIGPRRIGHSPKLLSFLNEAIKKVDIVQTHFLWLYPVTYAAWLAMRMGKALVMQPHGALFPAALSKARLVKRIWYQFLDGPALRRARCVVATSEQEAYQIRQLVQPQRLLVSPNGITLPDLPDRSLSKQKTVEMIGLGSLGKYLLYLGNITPHKNLEKLIDAWAGIQKQWPNHTLVLVGPGDPKYLHILQGQIEKRELAKRTKIRPPIYGEDKWGLLQGAEMVINPSRSENFSFVVGEALSCGTPVVASRGCPWECLETEGFGHWVETDSGLLGQAINDVLSWPTGRRQSLAVRGKEYIRVHYSWEKAAHQFIQLYDDLVQSSARRI